MHLATNQAGGKKCGQGRGTFVSARLHGLFGFCVGFPQLFPFH